MLEGLVLEHETINLRLDVCQGKPDNKVCLKWQLIHPKWSSQGLSGDDFENLVLSTPQEVPLIHLPKLGGELRGPHLVLGACILQHPSLNGVCIVASELVEAAENLGLYEIKDRPKLTQVILKGCPGQYESVSLHPHCNEIPPQLGVDVLGLVAFVNDQHIVAHLTELNTHASYHAKASDEDPTLSLESFDLLLSVGSLFIFERYNVRGCWAPLAQLSLPITFHGGRHDHDCLLDLIRLKQAVEVGAYLNGFSESHVISEDASFGVTEERVEPLDALFLVLEKVLINFRLKGEAVREVIAGVFCIKLEPALCLT